jgi:uncharacterized membrane protein
MILLLFVLAGAIAVRNLSLFFIFLWLTLSGRLPEADHAAWVARCKIGNVLGKMKASTFLPDYWRNYMSTTTEPTDRLFGALPYLLPLVYALPFGIPFLMKFPILSVIYYPLQPLLKLYSFPFAGLIIFFALYSGVVRNQKISRFIRFNTLQAILIDIGLILFGIVIRLFGVGGGLLVETLSNVAFLATLVACIYCMVQSILGKYAELPTISDAANAQLL